jgi:hypothetical protein
MNLNAKLVGIEPKFVCVLAYGTNWWLVFTYGTKWWSFSCSYVGEGNFESNIPMYLDNTGTQGMRCAWPFGYLLDSAEHEMTILRESIMQQMWQQRHD